MGSRELAEWDEFEGEFGPVLLHERIDAAAALVALTVWRAAGQKGDLDDFRMTWRRQGSTEVTDWLKAMAS